MQAKEEKARLAEHNTKLKKNFANIKAVNIRMSLAAEEKNWTVKSLNVIIRRETLRNDT